MSCTHRGPLMSFRAFALCGCCNAPAQSESPFSGLNLAAGSANTEARPDGPPPGRSESQPRQQRQSQNGAGPRQQGQIAANAPASLPEGATGDAAAARQSGGRGRGKPRSGRGRGRGSNSNGGELCMGLLCVNCWRLHRRQPIIRPCSLLPAGSDQQRGRAPASQPPGPLASATT